MALLTFTANGIVSSVNVVLQGVGKQVPFCRRKIERISENILVTKTGKFLNVEGVL